MMQTRKTQRLSVTATGLYKNPRGMEWEVDVGDLSTGGCRVADPRGGLHLGAMVKLVIAGTGPHRAEVAWRRQGQAGLAFLRPLSRGVLDALIRQDLDAAALAFELNSNDGAVRRFV